MEGRGRQHLRWRLGNVRQLKIRMGIKCRTVQCRAAEETSGKKHAADWYLSRRSLFTRLASSRPRKRLFIPPEKGYLRHPTGPRTVQSERLEVCRKQREGVQGGCGAMGERVMGYKHGASKASHCTPISHILTYDCFKTTIGTPSARQ